MKYKHNDTLVVKRYKEVVDGLTIVSKYLEEAIDSDATGYSPTSAIVRIDDAINHIKFAIDDIELFYLS